MEKEVNYIVEPKIKVDKFDTVTAVLDFYNASRPQNWFARIPFSVPASDKPIKSIKIIFEY